MTQLALKLDERRQLITVIAGLYFFAAGERGRRVMVETAGLDKMLPDLDLTGPPGVVAGDLIAKLVKKGKLKDEPKYHALGALLSYILTLGELSQEEAHFIAGLIVKYALVEDADFIAELRTHYSITESVQPPPDPVKSPAAPVADGPRRPLVLMGKQTQQLHQALISAFPSYTFLTRMVAFQLDERLEAIAGGGSLNDVVFQLIQWAEAQGRIEELIRAASSDNPGNPDLRAFVEQVLPPDVE